jgi:Glycoside hydrolase family 44
MKFGLNQRASERGRLAATHWSRGVRALAGLIFATVLWGFIPSLAGAESGTEVAYDGALQSGWTDLGWGPRTLGKGPAQVDVGNWQGWILGKVGADLSTYQTLSVRVRIPASQTKSLLRMRAGYDNDDKYPFYQFELAGKSKDRWETYQIPMNKLTGDGKQIDRLLFMASRQVAIGTFVEIDKIIFNGRTTPTTKPIISRTASISVDCQKGRQAINPAIYGVAFNALTEESQTSQFSMGATSRRWGGDPTSRFNWENGNAWNPGHNWYWRNLPVLNKGNAWQTFFTNNAKAKMSSALTIPLLGWVAKDTTSYSFPVSTRGAQQQTAPDLPDAGNGVSSDGALVSSPPPSQTSQPSTAEWDAKWIQQIRSGGFTNGSPLEMVILDNEPDLWSDSHRDIRTEPSTYDELLSKGVAYATAVRAVDSKVKIAGPASWGWWGYFYSGADAKAGFGAKPDRRAHGDKPFLEWYLTEMAKAEKNSGKRLLDIVDVHYYPSGQGVYDGQGGKTDTATNELRVRSTRGLWDRSYTDEGWVKAPVSLLPRLQDIVTRTKPGIGISIGEYNFSGENHISGAIAQAEALGRFGEYGLTSAYLWTHPAVNTPQYWGFRAFRNYDNNGSTFGAFTARSVVSGSGTAELSVFASTDPGPSGGSSAVPGRKTIVMVNRSSSVKYGTSLTFNQCGSSTQVAQWSYAGGTNGFTAVPARTYSGPISTEVAPWSIVVLRLEP